MSVRRVPENAVLNLAGTWQCAPRAHESGACRGICDPVVVLEHWRHTGAAVPASRWHRVDTEGFDSLLAPLPTNSSCDSVGGHRFESTEVDRPCHKSNRDATLTGPLISF